MGIQELRLWIGMGFSFLVVVFLMIAYFYGQKPNSSPHQYLILKFLCSFCAGVAGSMFTGEALFELKGGITPALNVLVSGTAGCALFFAVWFVFPKPPISPPPPGSYSFSVPLGWTFEATVRAMISGRGHAVDFVGFKKSELNAKLNAKELHADTFSAALHALRQLASPRAIRKYEIDFDSPTYRLRIP